MWQGHRYHTHPHPHHTHPHPLTRKKFLFLVGYSGVGYRHRIPGAHQFPHRSPASFSPIYIKSLTRTLSPKRVSRDTPKDPQTSGKGGHF